MRRLSILLGMLTFAAASSAVAQDTGPSVEVRARASEHFDRGIQFFNEGRFDAALAELARAHELAPHHTVLYNLARVHAALGQPVEATRMFERYLREGGDRIDARRRGDVEDALREQRSRIGRLLIETNVAGATISIDGVDVATTPLESPIPLAAGSHTVEAREPLHETVRRAVMIAGNTDVELHLDLGATADRRGTLRIRVSTLDVRIAIDGEEIGVSPPLAFTVPLDAGQHVVTATRRGYEAEERPVRVSDRGQSDVEIDMVRESDPHPEDLGRLRIALPNAGFALEIDGETIINLDLSLPLGGHRMTLAVEEREPFNQTFEIPAEETTSITPELTWTPEARRERLSAAEQMATGGIAALITGAVLAVAGLSLIGWNQAEISNTDAAVLVNNENLRRCESLGEDCSEIEALGRDFVADQNAQTVILGLSAVVVATGGAAMLIGIPLWLAAPNEESIDASATAELRFGPGGVAVVGQF